MSDGTAQVGALAVGIQRLQQQAEMAIGRLENLAQGLDQVVRQEVRAAFAEEFQVLGVASQRAAEALHAVRRAASVRVALWTVAVTLACAALPGAVAWSVLPSRAELERLRAEREELAASLMRLQQQGAKIDLRRCGSAHRLCVRIERSAPAYGAQADYLIVKGY